MKIIEITGVEPGVLRLYEGFGSPLSPDGETPGRNLARLHNNLRNGSAGILTAFLAPDRVLKKYASAFKDVPADRTAEAVLLINRVNNERLYADLRRAGHSPYVLAGTFTGKVFRRGGVSIPYVEEAFVLSLPRASKDPERVEERKKEWLRLAAVYDTDSFLFIHGKGNRDGEIFHTDGRPPERVTRPMFGLEGDYESSVPAEAFIKECARLDYVFNRGGESFRLEFAGNPVRTVSRERGEGPGHALTEEEARNLLRMYAPGGEKSVRAVRIPDVPEMKRGKSVRTGKALPDGETPGGNLLRLHDDLRSGALCFLSACLNPDRVLKKYASALEGIPEGLMEEAVGTINRENSERLFRDLRRFCRYTLYRLEGVYADADGEERKESVPEREESFAVRLKNCGSYPGWVKERVGKLLEIAKNYDGDSVLAIYGKGNRDGEIFYTDGRPPERVTRASFGLGGDYESSIPAEAFIEECESLDYTFNRGGRRFRLERVSGLVCSTVRMGPGELRRALCREKAEELLKPLRDKGKRP